MHLPGRTVSSQGIQLSSNRLWIPGVSIGRGLRSLPQSWGLISVDVLDRHRDLAGGPAMACQWIMYSIQFANGMKYAFLFFFVFLISFVDIYSTFCSHVMYIMLYLSCWKWWNVYMYYMRVRACACAVCKLVCLSASVCVFRSPCPSAHVSLCVCVRYD